MTKSLKNFNVYLVVYAPSGCPIGDFSFLKGFTNLTLAKSYRKTLTTGDDCEYDSGDVFIEKQLITHT